MMRNTSSSTSSWKIKHLLIAHIVPALAIYLLFSTENNVFLYIDTPIFRFVNSWIKNSAFWQHFWAFANHKGADWIADAVFIWFFFWTIASTPLLERKRKIAESIFILLYGIIIILLANELLFRCILHIQRNSPSLVLDNFTNLAEQVGWLKVKFKSPKSFPGDHATTALLFLAGFVYLARKQRIISYTAICFAVFLCLPRLVAGAHWATDILIGSGSIVTIFFSWAFYTPLAKSCIALIEHSLFTKKRAASLK